MTLGSKIRELRIKKGLTQSDLGAGLVTPSMISQIESDKANPSYKVLEAIAARLEEPLEFFLSDVESQLEHHTAYRVAKALILSESYDRASILLEMVAGNPASNLNVAEVKIDLGKCLKELSRFDEANAALQEAVELAGSKLQYQHVLSALNVMGSLEQLRRKPHRAIYYWRKGYDLFQLYLRQGKFEEARTECVGAINMTPKDSVESGHLMRTLAQSEAGLGNLNAAIEVAERHWMYFESINCWRKYPKPILYWEDCMKRWATL